jgi:hypothetical protein
MSRAIARRFVAGSALLLAAFLGPAASQVDDDLPDLGEQIDAMASRVALDLQVICPPASPSDQAAFDRCRASLFGDSELRRNMAPRLLWGRRNQDAGAALKDTNLTQFAPDVLAGLYFPLFMYSGEYTVEYVERERLYLIRLRAGSVTCCSRGSFLIRSGMKRRSGGSTSRRIPCCSGLTRKPPRSSSDNSPSAAASPLSCPLNRYGPSSTAAGCGWTRRDAFSRA